VMLILAFLIKTSPEVWDCKIFVALHNTYVFLLYKPRITSWIPYTETGIPLSCPAHGQWEATTHNSLSDILTNVPLISGQNAHQGEIKVPNLSLLSHFSNWFTFKLNYNCTQSKTRFKKYR
jgi:hypothetical protein